MRKPLDSALLSKPGECLACRLWCNIQVLNDMRRSSQRSRVDELQHKPLGVPKLILVRSLCGFLQAVAVCAPLSALEDQRIAGFFYVPACYVQNAVAFVVFSIQDHDEVRGAGDPVSTRYGVEKASLAVGLTSVVHDEDGDPRLRQSFQSANEAVVFSVSVISGASFRFHHRECVENDQAGVVHGDKCFGLLDSILGVNHELNCSRKLFAVAQHVAAPVAKPPPTILQREVEHWTLLNLNAKN